MIEFGEEYVGRKVKSTRDTISTPSKGIGVIIDYDDDCSTEMHYMVKFDCYQRPYWVFDYAIEFAESEDENINMPYDEIWKMLEPKMAKNKITPYMFPIYDNEFDGHTHEVLYQPEDFRKAVALAYKIGYMRAMKGRPFKYGDTTKVEVKVENLENDSDKCPNAPCCVKSKAGHWEKVDPNNLPKIGSKVRYARLDSEYGDDPDWIMLGDEGKVGSSNWFPEDFGIYPDVKRNLNCEWLCFRGCEDCLDVWVEGEGDAE